MNETASIRWVDANKARAMIALTRTKNRQRDLDVLDAALTLDLSAGGG